MPSFHKDILDSLSDITARKEPLMLLSAFQITSTLVTLCVMESEMDAYVREWSEHFTFSPPPNMEPGKEGCFSGEQETGFREPFAAQGRCEDPSRGR